MKFRRNKILLGFASLIGIVFHTPKIQAFGGDQNISISGPDGAECLIQSYIRSNEIMTMLKSGVCEAVTHDPIDQAYTEVAHLCERIPAHMRGWHGTPRFNTLRLYTATNTNQNIKFMRCLYQFLAEQCREDGAPQYQRDMIFFLAFMVTMGIAWRWLRARHHFVVEQKPNEEKTVETVVHDTNNTLLSDKFAQLKNEFLTLESETKDNPKVLSIKQEIAAFEIKYNCPATINPQHIMNIPITMSSGITYDKKSIINLFQSGVYECPVKKIAFYERLNTLPSTDIHVKNAISDDLTALKNSIDNLKLELSTQSSIRKKNN